MTTPHSSDDQDPSENTDKLDGLPTQPATEGAGPLYHRRYETEFSAPDLDPEQLMREVQADPNRFSPHLMATFEKTKGDPQRLVVGDHFLVHITGPWNGPVEVSEVDKLHFTLITLGGHMEAGRIRFALESLGDHRVRFMIESWARSRDRLVDFIYDKIPLARAAQSSMWINFCRAVAKFAQSELGETPEVTVRTQKWDGQTWVDA